MCLHICKCGVYWSHQDFPIAVLPHGGVRYDPCPFPVIYDQNGKNIFERTQMCPTCYEEKRRWRRFDYPIHNWDKRRDMCYRCGAERSDETEHARCTGQLLDKLSFKEYLQSMAEKEKNGKLTAPEIINLQLEEEELFRLLVQDMDEDKLEAHYNDMLKMMEAYRVRALRFRHLKVDHDIERLQSCTEDERAAFDEAKRKRTTEKSTQPTAAAVRQSKEERMINSFADKLMAGNPELTREQAVDRAKKMFA